MSKLRDREEEMYRPTIKIGNAYVSAKDFIEAVIANTRNETIHFALRDALYDAHTSFTITVLRDKPIQSKTASDLPVKESL
jgi:hypothetical protein